MKKPLKIGLTGGIGAGKSLVLELLKKKGIPVLQTDRLGHQLLQDQKITKIILRHFGKTVMGRYGKIDRRKLGFEVFNDPLQRRKLNHLLHPKIIEKVEAWTSHQTEKALNFPLMVVEVPLLFESGLDRFFDGVLCISAPLHLRRKRLLKRGWAVVEIKKREKSQWPQQRKSRKADWVIPNQKGIKELKYAVDSWLEKIQRP